MGILLLAMKGIQAKLKMKGYNIEEADMYLGVYYSMITNGNGQ